MTQLKDFVTCPCCGKQTFPKNAELNQQIFDVFMACVLSEKPFTYTYNLFHNTVSITCKEPSNSQIQDIARLGRCFNKIEDGKLKEFSKDVLFKLSTLWPMKNIVVHKDQTEKFYDIQRICKEAYSMLSTEEITADLLNKVMNTLNDPVNVSSLPMLVVNKVLDIHARNAQLLTTVGFDQDFYKGIPHI